jgi:hypothetical protein
MDGRGHLSAWTEGSPLGMDGRGHLSVAGTLLFFFGNISRRRHIAFFLRWPIMYFFVLFSFRSLLLVNYAVPPPSPHPPPHHQFPFCYRVDTIDLQRSIRVYIFDGQYYIVLLVFTEGEAQAHDLWTCRPLGNPMFGAIPVLVGNSTA